MIRRIEALNYRCLRYISQPLDNFHVLVGPNASGKTTFLDVVAFMGDLVSEGLEAAVEKRTQNFQDLVWMRANEQFEMAIEMDIPVDKRRLFEKHLFTQVRYEIKIGMGRDSEELSILGERVLLQQEGVHAANDNQLHLFPSDPQSPETIMQPKSRKGTKTIVNKIPGGNDKYYPETKGYKPSFKLGPQKSALANLPEDESQFPVATWLKSMLRDGIQALSLNSLSMRSPSLRGQRLELRSDGMNLPWVIEHVRTKQPERFHEWLDHLTTAIPDLEDIQTIERPEDRKRYLMVCYKNKLKVPSWMASDGTLRLLALTLFAYLPEMRGIYLLEEPENGIHPQAVDTMFKSLSSVTNSQVLLATHSPVIIGAAEPRQVLCFAKTPEGATDIVRGDLHPALKDWRGTPNLSILFASGVLG